MKQTDTTYKLLMLLNDGKFHSGQTLADTLKISRSAIWKASKQLSELGIDIQSISGKGYRIPHGVELLNQTHIEQQLDPNTKNALDQLIILNDKIGSTNDYLLSLIQSQPQKKIACFAEYQTQARGRRGRTWIAPYGTNIYHSLLWHFDKDPAEIVGLTLAIAVALTQALARYGIKEGISVKWPNDILWQGRKLAGILLEVVGERHEHSAVVIGVGLNTYIPHSLGHQINQPWVDVYQITQSFPRRNQLAAFLLNELIHALQLFEQEGLNPFIAPWYQLDHMMGKTVTLHTPNGKIKGIMHNISDKGELILLCDDGQEKHFLSGELSLRLEV